VDWWILAPYKMKSNVDEGWPPAGLVDKYGNEIEDRIYNLKTTIEYNWLEKFTK
jgi:type I restriction enzyme R subunit